MTNKVFYQSFATKSGNDVAVSITSIDDVNGNIGDAIKLSATVSDTAAALASRIPSAVAAWITSIYGYGPGSTEWLFNPMGGSRSFSNPSRSLNSAFQPSTAMDTFGSYSVSIASSLSLTGGQQGSTILEIADDAAFTTNVKTVAQITNGNTGTLTLGLNTVQTSGGNLVGVIPAGKYARLRTVNTTGTPTNTSVVAQEVQL